MLISGRTIREREKKKSKKVKKITGWGGGGVTLTSSRDDCGVLWMYKIGLK